MADALWSGTLCHTDGAGFLVSTQRPVPGQNLAILLLTSVLPGVPGLHSQPCCLAGATPVLYSFQVTSGRRSITCVVRVWPSLPGAPGMLCMPPLLTPPAAQALLLPAGV